MRIMSLLVVWVAVALLLIPMLACSSADSDEEETVPDRQVDDDTPFDPGSGDDDNDDSATDDDSAADDDTATDDDTGGDDDDDNDDNDNDDNNDDDDNDDNDDNNDDDASPPPSDMVVDDANGFTDVALDAAGDPHIVYHKLLTGLKHAAWNGASWDIEVIDNGLNNGRHAAIAMDPAATTVYAVYQDGLNNLLKAAMQTEKGWDISTVVESLEGDAWCDIVVDVNGYRYVSYHDAASGALCFARHLGTEWETEVVVAGTAVGLYTSIVLAAGVFHISYYDADSKSLMVASGDFGAWSTAVVDAPATEEEDLGRWSSLAVDGTGDLHVTYQDAGLLDLRYAKYHDGVWTPEIVHAIGNQGADACLALDTADRPYIAYQDSRGDPSLREVWFDGSVWRRSVLLDGGMFAGSFGFWVGCDYGMQGLVVSHYYTLDHYLMIYPAFP